MTIGFVDVVLMEGSFRLTLWQVQGPARLSSYEPLTMLGAITATTEHIWSWAAHGRR